MKPISLLIILLLSACGTPVKPEEPKAPTPPVSSPLASENLVVAAFNIQIFGVSKMSNPVVVNHLTSILSRFDVVLIQEIRDSSNTAIYQLLDNLNRVNNNRFDIVLSARAGRSSSKEQYAYIYDRHKVQLEDAFDFDDGAEPSADLFEREPFVAKFKTIKSKNSFFLVGIHTKPEDTYNEIQYLKQVYDETQRRWNVPSGIIMGDLNADCSYLSDASYANLTLVKDSRFKWHIPKTSDTTVGTTNCAYDNLITTGAITSSLVGAATVFNFQNYLNLSQSVAESVSDHYPVQMTLSF